MKVIILIFLMICSFLGGTSFAQVIKLSPDNLNHSVASQVYGFKDEGRLFTADQLLSETDLGLDTIYFDQSIVNLDFTSDTYWIPFTLYNPSEETVVVYFQTARPITNEVSLFYYDLDELIEYKSGDAIPFTDKNVLSNKSVFKIKIKKNRTEHFVLKLSSDGEIISVPMIFWEDDIFQQNLQINQFTGGLFYGIFLFVIIIYLTFYLLLEEISFLIYVVYVFFSGFLQFSLDGYAHQFLFPSGGYFTQHIVLLTAGLTVVFVVVYAASYLKLAEHSPRHNIFFKIFTFIVLTITILSLIPGKIYELTYPLINGFSLLAILSIVVTAIRLKVKGVKVSWLFISGITILIAGAIIFILGNFSVIDKPLITQNSLKVGTLLEIILLSILMASKYKELQEEKEQAQKQLVLQLEGANEKLESQVLERTKEIEHQKLELRVKNEDIISSIRYAQRIQNAILPSAQKIKNLLPESFVLFKPRDIVSGDFYWIDKVETNTGNKLIVYAAADCTGHGVPGAFVSIVGDCFLKLTKTQDNVNTPGEALDFLNQKIYDTFNSQYKEETIRDGMDIAMIALDKANMKMYFSGAKNPVYIVRDSEVIVIKGDKSPIGYVDENAIKNFTTSSFDLQPGDCIYTFSDGYADQFGGEKGKKFMYGRLKKLLVSINKEDMETQHAILLEKFNNWKGHHEQLDDVLLIGVRI